MNKDDFEIECDRRLVARDTKPIANLILNMGGCRFCKAFSIDKCGTAMGKNGIMCCTDYIHDFLVKTFSANALKST